MRTLAQLYILLFLVSAVAGLIGCASGPDTLKEVCEIPANQGYEICKGLNGEVSFWNRDYDDCRGLRRGETCAGKG